MRQIEQDTIRAVRQLVTGKRSNPIWRKSNMMAIRAVDMVTREHVVHVYLHGNAIARVDIDKETLQVTLAGWDTVTTRSRINALVYGLAPNSMVRVWRKRGVTQIFQDSQDLVADHDTWYPAGNVVV